eukprot:TRINITY_DN24683_c0_g1_i1.p1 TRINITY_DN24683_c0_g1~~TRINITY_DN24683_c0_g1_i1.p1  ORF type:complete len:266 (+),score=21.44 TRINITY_DN24683_c0_g1_i1:62-799(+)
MRVWLMLSVASLIPLPAAAEVSVTALLKRAFKEPRAARAPRPRLPAAAAAGASPAPTSGKPRRAAGAPASPRAPPRPPPSPADQLEDNATSGSGRLGLVPDRFGPRGTPQAGARFCGGRSGVFAAAVIYGTGGAFSSRVEVTLPGGAVTAADCVHRGGAADNAPPQESQDCADSGGAAGRVRLARAAAYVADGRSVNDTLLTIAMHIETPSGGRPRTMQAVLLPFPSPRMARCRHPLPRGPAPRH